MVRDFSEARVVINALYGNHSTELLFVIPVVGIAGPGPLF
jgi:hypothetical protein